MAEKGNWKGGYREDGGYDGVSEYDRDGNYVGTLEDYQPRQKAPETEQTLKIQMLRVQIPKIRKMKKILQTAAWTASGKRLITAVIWETGLRIMMKIRTAITVMSTIMSKDKKAFLMYSTGIWAFCQRLFCKCFG